MKFLCCFGSYCVSVRTNSEKEGRKLALSGWETLPEEGSRLLVSARRMRTKRRQRDRPGYVDWKPSLGSISENNVLPTERVGAEMDHQGKRKVKKNNSLSVGGSRSAAIKVHSYGRSYRDDYGTGSMASFLPAFVPTPFMF